jgi:hypothetical protein
MGKTQNGILGVDLVEKPDRRKENNFLMRIEKQDRPRLPSKIEPDSKLHENPIEQG